MINEYEARTPFVGHYNWHRDNWLGLDGALLFSNIQIEAITLYIPKRPNAPEQKHVAVFDGVETHLIHLTRGQVKELGPFPSDKGNTYLRILSEYPEPNIGQDIRQVGVLVKSKSSLDGQALRAISSGAMRDFPIHPDAELLSHVFDVEHYRAQLRTMSGVVDPYMHYLTLGWRLGYTPHIGYPLTIGDTSSPAATGSNPYVEYILSSAQAAPQQDEAQTLSPEPDGVDEQAADASTLLDGYWQASVSAEIFAARPDFRFDEQFYRNTYHDIGKIELEPAEHFNKFGRREGRAGNRFFFLQRSVSGLTAKILSVLRDGELRALVEAGDLQALELAFEIIALGHPADMAISDFSSQHYLHSYRDIKSSQLNPFVHYLTAGFDERRRTLRDLRSGVKMGAKTYDPARPTCIVCTHQLSATGAPVVAKNLVMGAAEKFNVIFLSLRRGPLEDDVAEHVIMTATLNDPITEFQYIKPDEIDRIDFSIMNSVECWPFVKLFVSMGTPFATYIHEYTDYTRPLYKLYLVCWFSDVIVFSSDSVRASWQHAFAECGFDSERDSTIIPQHTLIEGGIEPSAHEQSRAYINQFVDCDLSGKKLVYGAGEVQIRKGVDLFVMVATQIKAIARDTIFIWIGDGLNRDDIAYGIWLDKHIRQADLAPGERNLYFLPAGDAYPHLCRAADVMFMPSRMDPLPNVVFDATSNGTTVVLFEGASGFDDQVYRKSDLLRHVPYGRLDLAAQMVLSAPRKTLNEAGFVSTARGRAGETDPVDNVLQLFDVIQRPLVAAIARPAADMDDADAFDVSVLYGGSDDEADHRALERYKTRRYGRKMVWSSLDEARRTLRDEGGWMHERTEIVSASDLADSEISTPYSIHYHAFYVDGVVEELANLDGFRGARTIVFTTDTDHKADTLRAGMAKAGLDCEVIVVKNQGRDILPFLNVVDGRDEPDDSVWCHLHQKRSITSATTGEVWRKFLLEILLGAEGRVSGAVAKALQPDVGLVTAFDPYIVGWGFGARLLPSLDAQLPLPLPAHPLLFPIGNMFWTTKGVVDQLFRLVGREYPWPNEPIENDGTIFHLIERLWPAAAALAGKKSIFVHKLDQRRI